MQIEFTGMWLENFGSFSGKHNIKLNDTYGLNFIRGANKAEPRLGSNGAGKSTLLNALCWGPYGKTVNGLQSTDVRPWSGKRQTVVKVDFNAVYGDEVVKHRLIRTAGPNSLTLDDKTVGQDDVDKLLGMSFEVFRQTIMLGQGRPLFHDLPNRDKLVFLSDVLNLERWERYSQKASDAVRKFDMELSRCIGEAAATKVLVEELGAQVKRQDEEAKVWEGERTAQVKELNKKNISVTGKLERIKDNFAAADSQHDMCATTLKLCTTDLRKFELTQQDCALAVHKNEVRLQTFQRQHDEASGQLKALLKSKTCPTCNQPIKDQKVLLKNKQAVEGRIAAYLEEIKKLGVSSAEKALKQAKADTERMRAEHDRLSREEEKLSAERRLHRDQLAEVEAEHKQLKKDLERWESDVNPHRQRYLELRKAHNKAVQELKALETEEKTLGADIEQTKFWVKGFKDVRLYVLDDVLQELEFVTNSMLDAIGLVGWEVSYDVERETKSGTVQRGLVTTVRSPRNNGDVKWSAWSGGEGQRLRLVGALALSQVLLARAGVECNIEVLDEPTRHLSSEGVYDLCAFLADRAEQLGRTIWLVDHMAIESAHFNKVLTVSKTSAGSAITGG